MTRIGVRADESRIVWLGSDNRHWVSRYLHHHRSIEKIALFRCRFPMHNKTIIYGYARIGGRPTQERLGQATKGGRVRKDISREDHRHHGRPAAAWQADEAPWSRHPLTRRRATRPIYDRASACDLVTKTHGFPFFLLPSSATGFTLILVYNQCLTYIAM